MRGDVDPGHAYVYPECVLIREPRESKPPEAARKDRRVNGMPADHRTTSSWSFQQYFEQIKQRAAYSPYATQNTAEVTAVVGPRTRNAPPR